MSAPGLRLLTRGSPLALVQTGAVRDRLARARPGLDVAVEVIRSTGDRSSRPFAEFSAVGVFVKELEDALLAGRGDVAVHSLKDLPTRLPDRLRIGAVLAREDPRDAWISRTGEGFSAIGCGARVATSSPRRAAQLRARRPDLEIVAVRGNVDTRLEKLRRGEFDALVLALAGLKRLGREGEATEVLALDLVLPAPGQGAVALEIRDDSPFAELVAALEDPATRAAIEAERAFLLHLGGGCSVPVGAHATVESGRLVLDGVVADPASGESLRDRAEGDPARAGELGRELASRLARRGAGRWIAARPAAPSLAGRRILLTRGAGEDDPLFAELTSLGAEVVSCPAIAFEAPEDPERLVAAAGAAASYDWVAFTSATAVRELVKAGVKVLPAVAAVGPATARAVEAAGFPVALVAAESSGSGLARELGRVIRPGARVLFPRAREASRALPEALAGLGARVDEVEAYRTVPPEGLAAAVASLAGSGGFDAVAFLSPSAVRNFVAAVPPAARAELLERPLVACGGETTADAARALGLRVGVLPPAPGAAILARELVRALGARP